MSSADEDRVIDSRNQVSWRLPNDLSRRLEIELTKEIAARNHSRTINKTLHRANSEKGVIKNNDIIETAEIGTAATFQSRLWTALFGNVNRSIDELYRLCEEEGDAEMCLEAENLFERSGRDFKKLTERMKEQNRFGLDQSSGISWEVRKPTPFPFLLPLPVTEDSRINAETGITQKSVSQSLIVEENSGNIAYASYIKQKELNSNSSKLRAAALPFQPSAVSSSISTVSHVESTQVNGDVDLEAKGTSFNLSISTNDKVDMIDNSTLDPVIHINQSDGSKNDDSLKLDPCESNPNKNDSKVAVINVDNAIGIHIDDKIVVEGGAMKVPLKPEKIRITELSKISNNPVLKQKSTSSNISQPLRQQQLNQLPQGRTAHRRGSKTMVSTNPTPNSIQDKTSKKSNFKEKDKENLIRVNDKELDNDELEADIDLEVSEASEHVWRQVESWIEAEAMAEEAAWNVLDLGRENDNEDGHDNDEDGEEDRELSDMVIEGNKMGLDVEDSSNNLNRDIGKLNSVQKLEPELTFEPIHENNGKVTSQLKNDYDTESLQSSFSPISMSNATPILDKTNDGVIANNTIGSINDGDSNSFTINVIRSRSGSPVDTSPSYPFGHNRNLHAKLSSPDRRRAFSPSEAKKKQEARHVSAESNRDSFVAERRLKAMLVSNRVKMCNEKEQTKRNLAEMALEERLRDAEKRHEDCIKIIRDRAGNENTKVSEVMFINNMNAEGIVDELRQKLIEVEARVLAAVERRRDILTGITVRQRKKNHRKVQQMSELRLQLERLKMERWDKLQKRLEDVQTRRQARLREMQRRSDAKDLPHSRGGSFNSSLKDDKESSTKGGEGSLKGKSSCDLLIFKLNGLKDQLVNPLVTGGGDVQRGSAVAVTTDSTTHKNVNNTKNSDSSSSSSSSSKTAISRTSNQKVDKNTEMDKNMDKGADKEIDKISQKVSTTHIPSISSSRSIQKPASNNQTNISNNTSITNDKSNTNSKNSNIPIPAKSPPPSSLNPRLKPTTPISTVLSPTHSSTPTSSPNQIKPIGFRSRISSGISPRSPRLLESRPLSGTYRSLNVDALSHPQSPSGTLATGGTAISPSIKSISKSKSSNMSTIASRGKELSSGLSSDSNDKVIDTNSNGTNDSKSNDVDIPYSNGSSVDIINDKTDKINSDSNENCKIDSLVPKNTESTTEIKTSISAIGISSPIPITSPAPSTLQSIPCDSHKDGTEKGLSSIVKKKKAKKKKRIVHDAEMMILDSLLIDNGTVKAPLYPQTARPQLSKHFSALSKLIRNKKSAKTARDIALGLTTLDKNIHPSLDTVDSTKGINADAIDTDIRGHAVLSQLYSAYLSTAKGLPKPPITPPSTLPLPPHYPPHPPLPLVVSIDTNPLPSPNSPPLTTIHDLMIYLCHMNEDNSVSTQHNEFSKKNIEIRTAVKNILCRLDNTTGNRRKEIGLFIRQGGVYFLRVLLGSESGVFKPFCGGRKMSGWNTKQDNDCGDDDCDDTTSNDFNDSHIAKISPLLGINDMVDSNLLLIISKALHDISINDNVKDIMLDTGLTVYICDIIGSLSTFLIDWLVSDWCVNKHDNENEYEKVLPIECQALPSLLKTISQLLKHSTMNPLSNDSSSNKEVDINDNHNHTTSNPPQNASSISQSSSDTKKEDWIWYLFASGTVSSLSKTLRSFESLPFMLAERALPNQIFTAIVDVINGLCSYVRTAANMPHTLLQTISGQKQLAKSHMSNDTKEDINDHNNDMTPLLSMYNNNDGIGFKDDDKSTDDSPETSMINLTSPTSSPTPLTSLCNTPTELTNCSSKNKKFKGIKGRIKEMISILGTLQLGPILITMLHNLLGVKNKKMIDRKEHRKKETIKTDDKKCTTGAGSGEGEGASLLTASVYGLTGRIMETLNELGLTDPSLLQGLVQIPQGKELPLASGKGTFINLMTSKERIIPLSSLNKITNTDYLLVVGQCCSTMLESLMALMETPATSSLSNSNDTPIQLSNSANNASMIQQSTSYKLTASPCDNGSSSSSRINGDKNDNKSNIDNIHAIVSFHPIDADDSVRHLLSFLGLICTVYLGLDSNLHAPTSSTITNLIKMLIKLPPRYYSEERFMKQLFPTLIVLCKGREEYLHKDVCIKLQKFKDSLYSAH